MAAKRNIPKLETLEAEQKFGRLTAVAFAGRGVRGQAIWSFKCDCGNEHKTVAASVIGGLTRSCGCLRREINATHGMYRSSEYTTWIGMIQRCCNTKVPYYQYYGGRGIIVCDHWCKSFENFYADMGPKPSPKHSIERIKNDGNYEPGNCRWATRKEQSRNMRNNRIVVVDGISMTLLHAAEQRV